MAHEPFDLKLFTEAKDFLKNANDIACDKKVKPRPGMFTLFSFPMAPQNQLDEVYPKLLLGDKKVAMEGKGLLSLGVTHVVNASMGSKFNQTDTNEDFYKQFNIFFHGIPALDIMTYNMLPHLRPAADFIDEALNSGGMVYVHCQQGVSRSATVVLAYLMLKKGMDLMKAMKEVREKRSIYPNDGFLKQLCKLQKEIQDGNQKVDDDVLKDAE